MEFLERNYKILEKRMVDQMETSLGHGKSILDKEVNAGIFNIVVKPVVKSFYKYWSTKDAKVGTLEQIRVTLDIAKELVSNGSNTNQLFDDLIEKNFQKYLNADQTTRQCNKNHKNYNKLVDVTKKIFIAQVEESIIFFKVKEDINDYKELSIAAFKTKDIAFQALMRQLDYNEEGIDIVEQDDSILKILVGKNIILKVLRKGFEKTKQELIEELDYIFN
jgi:hypothetical protein